MHAVLPLLGSSLFGLILDAFGAAAPAGAVWPSVHEIAAASSQVDTRRAELTRASPELTRASPDRMQLRMMPHRVRVAIVAKVALSAISETYCTRAC